MSDLSYAYAVARIRVLEKYLLSGSDIEQMIAAPSRDAALTFLREKGWGDANANTSESPEAVFAAESAKIRNLLHELKIDPKILEIFSYQDLYHNLKAAVKVVCTNDEHPGIFIESDEFGQERMLRIVQDKAFGELPEHMRGAAQEAFDALLHTRDGQLCDIIIDRAALEAIAKAGKASSEPLIRDYADMFVSVADIKIAVRAANTGKTKEFLERAVASCESIDAAKLIRAAVAGREEILSFLASTRFAGASEALAQSPSAFERWCDNQLMETIKPQKYNPFSAGPVIAYKLARENEIRMARIILTAKANGLPEETIRERAREMYV